MRIGIHERLLANCNMDAVLVRKEARDETFGSIIKNEPENIKCYKYGETKYLTDGSNYKLVNMNHYIMSASYGVKPEDHLDNQIVRSVSEYPTPKDGNIKIIDCICY